MNDGIQAPQLMQYSYSIISNSFSLIHIRIHIHIRKHIKNVDGQGHRHIEDYIIVKLRRKLEKNICY